MKENAMHRKFDVYNPLSQWKKGDMPGDPTLFLILMGHGALKGGLVAVTHSLASDEEIDFAVDDLIKDLEGALNKAKRVLNAQRIKIRC